MDIMTILGLALRYGPAIKEIIDSAMSNEEIGTRVKGTVGPLAAILEKAGAEFFPKAAPALHLVGAVIASFDPNITKWLQASMNKMLALSPALDVDGIYGPKTRAAVEKLQDKLGLKIDGIAGTITQAAIQAALAKK